MYAGKEKPYESQTRTGRTKSSLIKRQDVIFFSMVLVGGFLIAVSQFIDQRLLSDGIVFIMVGFVGLLMSWNTSDIGQSIIDAVDRMGASLSEPINTISINQKEISAIQKEISKDHKEISASLKHVALSLARLDKSQDNTARMLEEIRRS